MTLNQIWSMIQGIFHLEYEKHSYSSMITALQDDPDDITNNNSKYLLDAHRIIHYAKRFTCLCHLVLPILYAVHTIIVFI